MQLFIDSADPTEIKTAWEWGIIDGVTTNPSLAAKVGRPYRDIVQEILATVDGPVSLEVISTEYDQILEQARSLTKLHQNVVVKIPCIQEGLRAAAVLSKENIKINITLVFGEAQALLAAKVGATYCSPFLGRVDDLVHAEDTLHHLGDRLIERIRKLYDNYDFSTKILAASIRDVGHVEEMAVMGADVSTVPFEVLSNLVKHSLTDKGLKSFLDDWNKAGLELPV